MKRRIGGVIATIMRLCAVVGLLVAAIPQTAGATVVNPAPTAKVSFTFDDGLASASTQAEPTLTKYGLTGTDYVITGCVGMTTVPNTCRADQNTPYMTWAQIKALQTKGWEIGSHTVDHKCLADSAATDPDNCQANLLTQAQVAAEMSQSKSALAAQGIDATDFAFPYGGYNNIVRAEAAKYYATQRGFKDQNVNAWPYNEHLLNDVPVQEGVHTVAALKTKIDQAIANKQWLILTFHDIAVKPSTDPDAYQYGTAELDQVAAYVASKQTAGLIKSVNVNQGAVTSTDNMFANGSFNNGIADGWTTDNATAVTKDTGTHGSYPDAVNAIKFASPASGNAHLFSPKVTVDPATTYMFKNYLNVQAITTGQVGFYVDEYDMSGNWISGQYLKQEASAFVENLNFTYKPSSAAVSKASLQVIAGGTGLTAYLDNVQMFALSTAVQTNLVANGTFDSGISAGWTTDSAATIKADAANHGSPANPVNSVSLTATTANKHLFSPKVAVTNSRSYSLSSYLDLRALTSNEIGFYMDEYDANGNWISGKYLLGVRAASTGTVGFAYTPSSVNVKSASLQVIVPANSGASAYFDDVKWY
jgi:peptidoglycan/xylan/chitin deacetylase (PgdA/CDA1 family)